MLRVGPKRADRVCRLLGIRFFGSQWVKENQGGKCISAASVNVVAVRETGKEEGAGIYGGKGRGETFVCK